MSIGYEKIIITSAKERRKIKCKNYYKNNPEKFVNYHKNNAAKEAEKQKKRHSNFPEKYLLISAWHRATKNNIPFNLTIEDIIIPKYCPILGIKLELGGNKKSHDKSPSIDKIIPELGYIKGNIVVISFRANYLKSNGSLSEFWKITQWLNKHYLENQW